MGDLTTNIDSKVQDKIMEDLTMPAITQYPSVVREALETFGPFFPNEPERQHLAEYLTGLMIAHKKNVSAINREFAVTTDQSCLNRWLTGVPWDAEALNRQRLDWLQQSPDTRYSQQGVIAIDNVLVDHDGKLIEDAGYFWDHAEQRNKIAHDYIIANYVCGSNKHYPLEFYRFVKQAQCQEKGQDFVDHNEYVRWLVDWTVQMAIPGDYTFDSYFTNAKTLNHINGLQRNYVGDLKFNRKIQFKGREMRADELAGLIDPEDRKGIKIRDKRQYYFTVSIRIPDVDHKVRIAIVWHKKNDKEACKILISNRTNWDVNRLLKVYRCRWRGTECFHRDGKQHLGMGDCQLRSGQGQTRHLYLVFLTHSILMRQMKHGRAREWARERLLTIGEACRAVLKEALSDTISWVVKQIEFEGWDLRRVKRQLDLP